jgi:Flp pilus assembly protein TadG
MKNFLHRGLRIASLASRKFITSRNGAIAVEFAFTFPIVLIFIMGVFEFGRYYWVQASLQHATTEVARQIMTQYTREYLLLYEGADYSSCGTTISSTDDLIACVTTQVRDAVQDDPQSVFSGFLNATPTWSVEKQGSGETTVIEVEGSVDFSYNIPFISPGTIKVQSFTQAPLINFDLTF